MHPSDDELDEALRIARLRASHRARAFAVAREAAVIRMIRAGLRPAAARDRAELREQRSRDLVHALDLVRGRILPGRLRARQGSPVRARSGVGGPHRKGSASRR
jgi:hypothetical protein